MIGMVIYRGGPPAITSPDILQQIYGCYYLDGRQDLVLSSDVIAHIPGFSFGYEVFSSKEAFRILPARQLVVASGPDGLRDVHIADGLPLYLPMRLGPNPTININTLDPSIHVDLQKAPCHAS